MFKLFGKKNPLGVTARNSYLDNHGYYLAMEKHRCIKADEHSAPQIPYVLFDLLNSKIEKSMACCVRWDIYTYRWGLHTFKRTSSCRIALKKKDSGGHRHFVRDGEQSAEQLQSYTDEHLNKFDLIFFDGPDKKDEVKYITPMLKNSGIVIMTDDFSDEYDYESALEQFKAAGYKALCINNPAPLFHEMHAALIYKDGNFLGL